MLWFSERTWVHHYVSFVLTLCAAGAILSDPAQPERARRLVRRALIVFSFATCFASEAGRVLGPDGVDWAKGVGVFLWPSLLVTIAVIRPWKEQADRAPATEIRRPLFRYYSAGAILVALRATGRIIPHRLVSGSSTADQRPALPANESRSCLFASNFPIDGPAAEIAIRFATFA